MKSFASILREISGPAIIAFAVAACGGLGDRSDTVVRDSAGITIVENRRPLATDARWWRIDETPTVDIGGIDAPPTHALFRVVGAARLSDGRVVVASNGSNDVRFYSADGAHLATIGRKGGGPREFDDLAAMIRLPGDTLLVSDPGLVRISYLDPQGTFTRSVTSNSNGGMLYATVVGRFSDGSLAAKFDGFTVNNREGISRPAITFVRLSATGIFMDTIAVVPGDEYAVTVDAAAQSINLMPPPFAKSTHHAVYGDRLYIGTQDAPEVQAYDTAGNVTRIIRTGARLRPVTEQRLEVYTLLAMGSASPDQRERVRERIRKSPRGEYLPAYGAIATDLAGNLWIADYDDPIGPTGEWNVFDPDGRTLARVTLPIGFRAYEIGEDYVLGVVRDEYDTEHVVLYRLVKNPS